MTPEDKIKLDSIGALALSTRPTLDFSFELAEKCIKDGVPGDFVECGVYAGSQCAAMAYACQKHGDDRTIHMFDSFDGIPEAGPLDNPKLSRQSKCTFEQCFGHMTKMWGIEAERLLFHPGWFKDTIPGVIIEQIAILRLDGDLYESTKTAIEGLFPFVVDGGYCIIDDYALRGCQLAVQRYFAEHNLDYEIHKIEGGLGPVWFRKEKQ